LANAASIVGKHREPLGDLRKHGTPVLKTCAGAGLEHNDRLTDATLFKARSPHSHRATLNRDQPRWRLGSLGGGGSSHRQCQAQPQGESAQSCHLNLHLVSK
jgi:hypothetical protein